MGQLALLGHADRVAAKRRLAEAVAEYERTDSMFGGPVVLLRLATLEAEDVERDAAQRHIAAALAWLGRFPLAGTRAARQARAGARDAWHLTAFRLRPLTGARSPHSEWWAFVHGERSTKERLPEDVPMTPYEVYDKSGWTSWDDFLGTDNPARHLIEYRSFTRACAYVRALGLANASE